MTENAEPPTESIPILAPGVAEEHPDLVDGAEEGVTFAEAFYPARPKTLRPRARRRSALPTDLQPPFEPVGTNPAYVHWLENQSMFGDGRMLARQLSGRPDMWGNAYAAPHPRGAIDTASVWFTAYPISLITDGSAFLESLGSEDLWQAFSRIGIRAIHTGPVKLAGGISGWNNTPSIDGHFDRISMTIDPMFGTEENYRAMQEAAANHGGTIIDDLVPAHTGKGSDFRLAEMAHRDYPGIYHMVAIPPEAWHLLPEVPHHKDSVNLTAEGERALKDAGYIIGELQRVIFYEPGVKETNWSATKEVVGTDGVKRRWVYLHYFKDGQPSINWLDPTFAGMRLVMGDALHALVDLGAGGLRLDANGFLGVERAAEDDGDGVAWSEDHPLSVAANQLIGSMVRKVGGFTFQELNLSMDAIRATSAAGPDLSYDFVTRPAYQHALVTGNTEFLRLTLREAMAVGVDLGALVHALQNHDELTYELVHFGTTHRADTYSFRGQEITGGELAETIREDLRAGMAGDAAPYNALFTTNGIASTSASVVTAALGIADLDEVTDAVVPRIRDAHLLLAAYNALQPGVFALSGWDLVGALPVPRESVAALVEGGDTRWIERGAHDLMGTNPEATVSVAGIPRARVLYGPLPEQLEDPDSFASRLASMLHLREAHGVATGTVLEIPEPDDAAMLVMVNRLAIGAVQVSVFNFAERTARTRIASEHLREGAAVVDLGSYAPVATVTDGAIEVELGPFGFQALMVQD